MVVNKEELSPHVIKLETNQCGKMYYLLWHTANWYIWATVLFFPWYQENHKKTQQNLTRKLAEKTFVHIWILPFKN